MKRPITPPCHGGDRRFESGRARLLPQLLPGKEGNMPKITRAKTVKLEKTPKKQSNSLLPKWGESYSSLLIGLIVVVLVAIIAISFARSQKSKQTSSTQTKTSTQNRRSENLSAPVLPKTYIVKSGDNLWVIAEKIYKSGYNWVDIAKANSLTESSLVYAGNKLIIPDVKPKIITIEQKQESSLNQIGGSSYIVVKGDYLWEIAIRAYGDGYAWVKIAKANNLANPNLIFSGNVLRIPR